MDASQYLGMLIRLKWWWVNGKYLVRNNDGDGVTISEAPTINAIWLVESGQNGTLKLRSHKNDFIVRADSGNVITTSPTDIKRSEWTVEYVSADKVGNNRYRLKSSTNDFIGWQNKTISPFELTGNRAPANQGMLLWTVETG